MRVIERFQGAWAGATLAAPDSPSSRFQTLLNQQAQSIESLTGYSEVAHSSSGSDSLTAIAHTLIVSILFHEDPSERAQTLVQVFGENIRPVLQLLSDRISLQFKSPSVPLPTEVQAIWTSIQGTIQQQLPLQDALEVIQVLPQLTGEDHKVAIALYCWHCTPMTPTIAIKRAQTASKQIASNITATSLECDVIETLTGWLCGLSVGSRGLPRATSEHQIAHHLFNLWAGIYPGKSKEVIATDSIILSPGILKPRTPNLGS